MVRLPCLNCKQDRCENSVKVLLDILIKNMYFANFSPKVKRKSGLNGIGNVIYLPQPKALPGYSSGAPSDGLLHVFFMNEGG